MDWNFVFFSAIKIAVAFAVLMTMVAYAVLVERKVCAGIQDRVGPNRAAPPFIAAIPVIGPFLIRLGLFHPLADGLKLFLKEDFTPAHVRKMYFWLAPAITMIPALLVLAIIPFGSNLGTTNSKMVIADLNVGVLYTFGIVSLGVYGIVLAGYASNSKFPFLGGIRASAQMISYELAMGMSVIPIFLLVGGLSLSQVIDYQAGRSWDSVTGQISQFAPASLFQWMIFKQPLAFAIFIVAALAETNRMPFDFPEAEQELAGGYNVEYSSMKFGMFFMGEYANMVMSSALVATLFLGGWTLPWFGLDHAATSLWGGLLHIAIFLAKLGAVLLLMIWVRWMLPRFRYDQLMDLGWRRFIPLALANILVTALFLWARA